MADATAFVAFGPGKRKIRPSNWIERLIGMAAAHWQKDQETPPCGTCAACPDATCFVFPVSLHRTHPALVRDLLFCLRMLEVPEVSAHCPRNADDSDFAQRSAA